MVKKDILIVGYLFKELTKEGLRREVGCVNGTTLIGTKIYQDLGDGKFLYGINVYAQDDLPIFMAEVDLDRLKLDPIHNIFQLNDKSAVFKEELNVAEVRAIDSKCAVLISNAEDCPDVEWI